MDTFFSTASALQPDLFRLTYGALKHCGFDRLLHPLPNSCYSREIVWVVYPGDEFMTEWDSAVALIAHYHSRKTGATSSATASIAQAGPSSVRTVSLGLLNYKSSFILPSALRTATVLAQSSSNLTTSTFPVSSQDPFMDKALQQYNAAIGSIWMHAHSQLQLRNPTMAGAPAVLPVILTLLVHIISLLRLAIQFSFPTMPPSYAFTLIALSNIPVYVPPLRCIHNHAVAS